MFTATRLAALAAELIAEAIFEKLRRAGGLRAGGREGRYRLKTGQQLLTGSYVQSELSVPIMNEKRERK